MTYRLYNRKSSGGFVVEAALTLCGAPFELIELDSRMGTPLPESFKSINPWGQVPTLVLPDGTTLTETSAILIHLANCYPEAPLAPRPGSSDHGQFLRWLIFANVNIYESALRSGYPERYTTDAEGIEAVRSAAIKRMSRGLELLDSAISPGPYLFGDKFSIADVYFAMLFTWHRGTANAPHVRNLAKSMPEHPIVGPLWQHHYGRR